MSEQNELMTQHELLAKLKEEGATGYAVDAIKEDCIYCYISDTPRVHGYVYTRVKEGILSIPISNVDVDDGYEQLELSAAYIAEPEELETMAGMMHDIADAMSKMAKGE